MTTLENMTLVKKYLKLNAHHKTQVYSSVGVLLKDGTITLELHKPGGSVVVTNGWLTNWIIFYGFNGKWASDNLIVNKKIVKRLNKIAQNYLDK